MSMFAILMTNTNISSRYNITSRQSVSIYTLFLKKSSYIAETYARIDGKLVI